MAEGEMVRQHRHLNGCESENTLRIVEDRGAWLAAVQQVAESRTWLGD